MKYLITILFVNICFTNIILSQDYNLFTHDQQIIPDLSWLNQTDGPRPKYVWENREDYIYHEMYYPDSLKMTAPEIFPLIRCAWVFNQAMKWIRNFDGTIIAYTEDKDLYLTGVKQVSAWYSDPENSIDNSGNVTIFKKNNTKRRKDCAVLPSFQFHLGQHSILELTVHESSDDWQFVISRKGRSGVPIISSGWQSGAKTIRFDIAQQFRNQGIEGNYAEVHMAIGTWAKSFQDNSSIKFEAKLVSQPAVVSSLPVIRTLDNTSEGIPLSALITGSKSTSAKVFATVNGQTISLYKQGEIWKGNVKGLSVGSYNVVFNADTPGIVSSTTLIRITDGDYWKHNKQFNSLQKNTIKKSTLTGSFQGTLFFKDVGLASEQMINCQKEWDEWDKKETPGEHQHYWESLTRSELNLRFAYLAKNGWDIVHLHSHWGIWERFDASGNLAPHGIEQFARYVDEASKNGLSVQVTLSSYPYSFNTTHMFAGTIPYKQTIEKGFKNEDWYNPDNDPFRSIYHQYIKDFITTFKDETSIISFSSSGEGDWKNGIKRFQDTKKVIRSIDTKHILVSEPFFTINKFPSEIVEGFTSDLVGSRNYGRGTNFNPDEEMSLLVHYQQVVPNSYIAEGSYPSSNLYTKFTFDKNDPNYNTWVGRQEYRYNLRDWLYIGLANRIPLIVTWDEVFTEDEHLIANEASKVIDWNQPVEPPSVAIILTDRDFSKARVKLGRYERIFSKLAVNYRFIENPQDAKPGEWVLNSSQPFDSIRYSNVSNLPTNVQNKIPFQLSPNYSTQYSLAADRKTMTAYIYNKSNYEKNKKYYLSGTHHRIPVPTLFELTFKNLPANLNYQIYDLDAKSIINAGKTSKNKKITIQNTKSDYLLIMFP